MLKKILDHLNSYPKTNGTFLKRFKKTLFLDHFWMFLSKI